MKKFCKVFDSDKFGQILVQRDQNDDGEEVLAFTVDTHPNDCAPTKVSLSLNPGIDVSEKLEGITAQEAEAMAEAIYKQVEDFFN